MKEPGDGAVMFGLALTLACGAGGCAVAKNFESVPASQIAEAHELVVDFQEDYAELAPPESCEITVLATYQAVPRAETAAEDLSLVLDQACGKRAVHQNLSQRAVAKLADIKKATKEEADLKDRGKLDAGELLAGLVGGVIVGATVSSAVWAIKSKD